jgi:hypothetical protein
MESMEQHVLTIGLDSIYKTERKREFPIEFEVINVPGTEKQQTAPFEVFPEKNAPHELV